VVPQHCTVPELKMDKGDRCAYVRGCALSLGPVSYALLLTLEAFLRDGGVAAQFVLGVVDL
jgi:hypothetical protein